MSHDFMIFYKVNKKDIGNLRIFLNSMKLEKMDILETKIACP
jgi:hypothetical protein